MKLALRRLGHQPLGQQWKATAPKRNAANAAETNATLLNWLERVAQAFRRQLMVDAEPRVWYTCDAEGHLWWHAYEPMTRRSLYDASEAEMRVWLEQRHYSALAK